TVRVNGRPLKMMLDTGAVVSAIPESAAAELGLETEELPGHTFGGASGTFRADRGYTADIELGGAKLEIVPGHRLLLRPRGDLRLTAEARVRRWPWMPACRSPGCARARIEPAEPAARLEVDVEAPLPGPIEFLFGCADRPAGTEVIVTSGQRAIDPYAGGFDGAPFRHLLVGLESPSPGQTSLELAAAGRLRISADGPPCRELTVLDVAPARR